MPLTFPGGIAMGSRSKLRWKKNSAAKAKFPQRNFGNSVVNSRLVTLSSTKKISSASESSAAGTTHT